jgi:hypothetical protein
LWEQLRVEQGFEPCIQAAMENDRLQPPRYAVWSPAKKYLGG